MGAANPLGIALVSAAWLVFGACAVSNGRSALARPGEGDARAGSMVPLVGGMAGLAAAHFTFAWASAHLGTPAWLGYAAMAAVVLLDVGTGAFLLVMGLGAVAALTGAAGEEAPPEFAAPRRAAVGSLLGTAVGDAVGLAMEGLSRRRLARLYPRIDGPRLLAGRGLCSDDTEHSCLVALSIVARGDEVEGFTTQMRSRLRWWLASLPAGVGLATLRAILKLWLFVPRRWQGVHSAGNGPAMRSALLGALFAERPDALRAFVHASTVLTHRDPKAECAALAVALAARAAARGHEDGAGFLLVLEGEFAGFAAPGAELLALLARAVESAARGEDTAQFAEALGLGRGVSGYAYHTVPVALHGWLRHPRDFRAAVAGVIECGGDTDTAAAITGGIVGAGVGPEGIPPEWRARVVEWPASMGWMERLADNAARRVQGLPPRKQREPSFLLLLPRNLLFLAIVLAHGFRRLFPPY
jgi:ADP-ribosylglycohydrolase